MIRGHKPNAYTVAFTADGHRIEAETRACIHCQFNWSYGDPHGPEELDALLGHPTRRGWCVKCEGWLCGRRACIEQQAKLTELWLSQTGKVRDCIPFEEWANRVMDKVAKYLPLAADLAMTEAGIIVPRTI
jgi:hypothetical protein